MSAIRINFCVYNKDANCVEIKIDTYYELRCISVVYNILTSPC